MKQLKKKAAALAALAAVKEQSMQAIPTPPSPSTTLSVKRAKQSTKNTMATRRVSNNIAVLCATESLASYREGLKQELSQKKKIHGTLNFDLC